MQKKNKFQIQIPEPCHEKWSDMTPNEKGRYCDQCAKTIVDFSQVSDNELAQLFIQKKGKICGRFNTTQLNRDIQIPMPAKPSRNAATVGLLLTSMLGATIATSQTTPTEQIEVRHIQGKIAMPQTINEEPIEKTFVEGIVRDAETGEAILFAPVQIKGYEIKTETDIEGKYKLEIPDSLKNNILSLLVNYPGYNTKEYELPQLSEKAVKIDMSLSGAFTLGIVASYRYEEETLWKKLKNIVHHLKEKRADKKFEKRNRKKKRGIEKPIPANEIKNVISPTIETHFSIQVKIYPNPFVENLKLELYSEKEQVVLLRIFSMDGKEVFSKKEELFNGFNEIQLDLNLLSLVHGSYLLQIVEADGLMQQFPLVKIDRL